MQEFTSRFAAVDRFDCNSPRAALSVPAVVDERLDSLAYIRRSESENADEWDQFYLELGGEA